MKNKKTLFNHQIRAKEIRVINQDGSQLGIMTLEKALELAKESDLDLIQVTDKVIPPICKITNYGKYLYDQQKKEKNAKAKIEEIKGIRLSFGISEHDMQIKAKMAQKFLEKGDKVRIEMRLKGRQKGLTDFAKEKIKKFIEILSELTLIEIEREIKMEPRGITTTITKGKKHEIKN